MNDDGEPEERRHGAHSMRFVPPDMVVVTLVGVIAPSELLVLDEWLIEFAKDEPWLFAIADITRLTSMPMRSRRAASQGEGTRRVQAAAIIGASQTMQVVFTVLHKAISMLRREAPRPLAFVETEAEGRAFLNDCRRALQAECYRPESE